MDMARTLTAPGGKLRMIGSTTTAKMAERLLHAGRVFADELDASLNHWPVVEILMSLHLAEDEGRDLTIGDLDLRSSPSKAISRRWVAQLVAFGLVDQRGDLIALTEWGYVKTLSILESVYAAQRALD